MASKVGQVWIIWQLCLVSQSGYGIEGASAATAYGIKDRWGVVGVISESDPKGPNKGVAVLKHLQSGRTYTVSVGESLPHDSGVVLQGIQAKKVKVAPIAGDAIELAFIEASSSVESNESEQQVVEPSRTERFLNQYYQGLKVPNDLPPIKIDVASDGSSYTVSYDDVPTAGIGEVTSPLALPKIWEAGDHAPSNLTYDQIMEQLNEEEPRDIP